MLKRGRSSKALYTDIMSFGACVFRPAKIGCHFHRYSSLYLWRQNRFAVALVLIVKQLPRRHADHSRPHSFFAQLFVRVQAERDLAAGADQNDVRTSARGLRENVSAASQT